MKTKMENKEKMWNYSHYLWTELHILTLDILSQKKLNKNNDYDELLETIVECRDRIEDFKMEKCSYTRINDGV
jgi:hypothetical protein